MRVIVQRASGAKVSIEGNVVGQIARGMLLLVGITHTDTQEDVQKIARKIAAMRIFEDAEGKMNLGLKDIGGAVLSISQFTLYADCKKGNRPSFIAAARPEQAEPLYAFFNDILSRNYGIPVATGRFGADMKVDFVNDGPVTIILDSSLL